MGLNVGGIYVRGSDQAAVVAAVKKFWIGLGALPLLEGDPLALAPLSVEKTGQLGYCVFPATPDAAQTAWIALYDSERYHASSELAEFLAHELDTLVAIYSFTSSVDQAALTTYTGSSRQAPWREDTEDWGEVEDALDGMPFAAVYFNQLAQAESLEGAAVFGFQGLPYREGAVYRGPSEDEQRAAGRIGDVAAAIARGDADSVRAIYAAHPDQHYTILSTITDAVKNLSLAQLEAAQAKSRVVLAFADELLADPSVYWGVNVFARVAFLAGERAQFERAVAVSGRHADRLAEFSHALMQAKRWTEAIDVARELLGQEGVALSTYNNLAHALSQVPTLPSDAATLLARCDDHGMANSYIFHNTACAWVRLGDHDRAIEAVRGAVRAGYPQLARMREDTDLAPLFADPRYADAFAAPQTLTLDQLIVRKTYRGAEHVVQRPVLMFRLFLAPLGNQKIGPALADLVEAFVADVPAGELAAIRRNAPWKPLGKGQLTKELTKLRKATDGTQLSLHIRGATDQMGGAATPYGIEVESWITHQDPDETSIKPHASLWFPGELAHNDVDALADRFARYCGLVPVEAGGAGLHVLLRASDYGETWWDRDMLGNARERFFGHEDHPGREWAAGTSCGAQWLTVVGGQLLARLGGAAAVRAAVPGAQVREVGDALIVRASLRPGLGVPPAPTDLGVLPQVARMLEPAIIPHTNEAEPPSVHYTRLCSLAEHAYDNGPPVVPNAELRLAAAAPKKKPKKPAAKK